ncbi:uncharacterized protein LOC126252150 [Schistocerca nitens]|uniref:uncharacterized protein LOC126252150 n=1 Tax=Schistocerca nitens TaxID=7011 RepID=UPI0021183DA7|nr:uncharacterized protein LOC126252150 [Schistocerca nitens]
MSGVEETIMICGAALLMLEGLHKQNERRPRRWWRKTFYRRTGGNNLLRELSMEDGSGFPNFTRISPTDFEYLANMISPFVSKKDTNFRKAISVNQRLAVTLRFLATGDSFQSLAYLFRISKQAISKIVPEVCGALVEVLKDYVKIPATENDWSETACLFSQILQFPHCVGAIDGKHIVLQCPVGSGSEYYNYKGSFSIVLLAVVDASYNFLYADIGCQGRISDGGVFKNASINELINKKKLNLPHAECLPGGTKALPNVFVADDAFPLQENIMKPYLGKHVKGSKERVFNYRLSRARMVVENTFGIMASVFRVFRKPMLLQPEKAKTVTLTAVCLHNFLRRNAAARNQYTPHGSFDSFDLQTGEMIPGTWRRDDTASVFISAQNIPRKAASTNKQIRDEFANYFLSPRGSVPWQNNDG